MPVRSFLRKLEKELVGAADAADAAGAAGAVAGWLLDALAAVAWGRICGWDEENAEPKDEPLELPPNADEEGVLAEVPKDVVVFKPDAGTEPGIGTLPKLVKDAGLSFVVEEPKADVFCAKLLDCCDREEELAWLEEDAVQNVGKAEVPFWAEVDTPKADDETEA